MRKTRGREACLLRSLVLLLTFPPPVWIIGHVESGWDGSDALETQSNLCEYHAFLSHSFDELTFLSSLPNVSRSQPSISLFGSYPISASTASPHMLLQVSFRRV